MDIDDLDINDDQDGLSPDDILEAERQARDPNLDVMRHRPKLTDDFETPAASQNDPLTRDLPVDHPKLDSDIDKTEAYDEDTTDASEFWSQHDSNDRTNDALHGDNGPDL